MPKLVFHTLHVVVSGFPDSMEEELKLARDEASLWYRILLVPRINTYRQGNGLLAEFRDDDIHNDLKSRMEAIAKQIFACRQRIVQIGYWPERSIADITRKGLANQEVRASEVRFFPAKSAAA